jgi:hypothetical protein
MEAASETRRERGEFYSLEHGRHLITATIVIVFVLTVMLILANNDQDFPLLPVVFSVGTVGGLFNTYRRFNLIPSERLIAAGPADWQMTLQIYMSPLIGGLFGLVLYLIFLTGIVKGDLFPSFPCAIEKYQNLMQVLRNCQPGLKQDAAKALFWAFVGGFSEWFVPNLLDRFARENAAG